MISRILGTLPAPQTYFNTWSSTRSGFFTQVADGIFAVGEGVTPAAYTNPEVPSPTIHFVNPLSAWSQA